MAIQEMLKAYEKGELTARKFELDVLSAMNLAYNSGLDDCIGVISTTKDDKALEIIQSLRLPDRWEYDND